MRMYFAAFVVTALIVCAAVAARVLKRYLRSARTLIGIIIEWRKEASSVIDLQKEAIVAVKSLAFYQKPVVQRHFTMLDGTAGSSASEKTELSYSLSRVVDRVSLKLSETTTANTVICTVAIGDQFRSQIQPCLDSQSNFARRNSVAYCVLDQPPGHKGRPPAWMKIPLIVKLLQAGYKRVLFIDADAMVTNQAFDIDNLFVRLEGTQRPILVTEDEDGVNTGVMFIQNIDAAFRLLDLIWLNDTDIENGTWEQQSLNFLMGISNSVKSSILIEPNQKQINSFPVERRLFFVTHDNQIWSSGDFICHFSGIRSPYLQRYISDYSTALRRNAVAAEVTNASGVIARG